MLDEHIAVPFWLLLLLIVLSAMTLLRILWWLVLSYLRGQSKRAKRRLDEHLSYGISPHTLKSRSQWKEELLLDPLICEAIKNYAQQGELSEDEVRDRVKSYLEEMVPSFNVLLYFRVGFWLARALLRSLYSIQVGYSDVAAYQRIGKNTAVILASNHRSNVDPLIHIYLASRHSTISFSAGEWSRGWPFRQLLHAIGFYIVRRDSGDPLYRRVLERYIFHSVCHCIPMGLFVEGGLTRDGALQEVKLGSLNYSIKALGKGECEDIVIIPAAVSYDKVPEDKTLIAHQQTGFRDKGRFYSLVSSLRFVAGTGAKLFQRRFKPFGYACVNYGEPISILEWQEKQQTFLNQLEPELRRERINALGELITARIQALVPVPPIAVLAEVISRFPNNQLSAIAIKTEAYALVKQLRETENLRVMADIDDDFALDQGLSILVKHKVIIPDGAGNYQLLPDQEKLLDYYAQVLRC